jgi:hypothetical protein
MLRCDLCQNDHAVVQKDCVRKYFEDTFQMNFFEQARIMMAFLILRDRSLAKLSESLMRVLPFDVLNHIVGYLFILLAECENYKNNYEGPFKNELTYHWGYLENLPNVHLYRHVFNHCCPKQIQCPSNYCRKSFSSDNEFLQHFESKDCLFYVFACWGCGMELNRESYQTHECIYKYVEVVFGNTPIAQLSELHATIGEREDAIKCEPNLPTLLIAPMSEEEREAFAAKSKWNKRGVMLYNHFDKKMEAESDACRVFDEASDRSRHWYYGIYKTSCPLSICRQFDHTFKVSNRL